MAFAKGQLAAGGEVPQSGNIFISIAERQKDAIVPLAVRLAKMGFSLLSTEGTAKRLKEAGVPVKVVKKLQEGHPNVLDYILNNDLALVMNTPSGKGARTDEGKIRAAAVMHNVPCITTIQAA